MRHSFLVNLLFALILNLAFKPLYLLVVEVGVQNRVGPVAFGLYFAMLNCAYLLQIINDFGLQIFQNRQVAANRSDLAALFPGLLSMKLILSVLYIIGVWVLSLLLGIEVPLSILLLISFNLILTSFVLFVRSGISGLGYYRLDSVLSVLDKVFMLVIVGGSLLVFNDDFTITHFVVGQTLSLGITLGIGTALLRRFSEVRLGWLDFSQILSFARRAWPFALAVFLMTSYTRLDAVMLVSLLDAGEYESGVYAAGYRILDALNMLAYLFAVLLLPMFSAARDQPDKLRQLLDQGFRYMWILVVPACAFGVIFRQGLMSGLYTESDAYWALVFGLLILNFLSIGLMYIFGTFLTAVGSIRQLNVLYFATVLLNVVLNLILIPEYKAVGAAVSTLFTQAMVTTGLIWLSTRKIPVRAGIKAFVLYATFALLCIGLCLALWIFGMHWMMSLLVILPGVIGIAFLTRLLHWTEIRAMVTNR